MPELIKAELSLIPALAALRRRRVNSANWLSVFDDGCFSVSVGSEFDFRLCLDNR
jgi:hypothetical protein